MCQRNRHAQELREQTATQNKLPRKIQALKTAVEKQYSSNNVSIILFTDEKIFTEQPTE